MQHIAAILLAAGQSKRMGCSKQLLPLGDKPVIRWCIDSLMESGLEDIFVVLGPNGQKIADTIKNLPVNVVWNADPESDMAGSIKTGLSHLHDTHSGILVCLVDHPLVSGETINAIIATQKIYPDKIIIPTHEGRKGHPTLFPRLVIEELSSVSPLTLRDIIHKDPKRVSLVNVQDEGVLINMNTPDDHLKINKKIR